MNDAPTNGSTNGSTNNGILVVDVGTSGLRAAVVRPDGSIDALHHEAFVPSTPFAGLVEFDPAELATRVLRVAHAALAAAGPVDAVGIANQRASTIVWNRRTGRPTGPALGWQDLRTVGECMAAKVEHGLNLAPNQTATKAGWMLRNHALDGIDPADLVIGTVDSWVAWTLSGGERLHVSDHTNVAVTGLATVHEGTPRWNARAAAVCGVPLDALPNIVPSSGVVGVAAALPGSPPIAALAGDQQASLIGQSCVRPGMAKATFGTGGMLDIVTGDTAPSRADRTPHGTFPIVAWSTIDRGESRLVWGSEAVMLAAGSNVEWLRDDLGLVASADETARVARECASTDGVMFVPALLGLGTPSWDYGARGALVGITRGTTRAHVVRAVLEGVAHRGADLLDAVTADHPDAEPNELRIDGGMSRNEVFVQALADATSKPVSVSPVTEATTLGAAYLAGPAVGTWSSLDDIAHLWRPLTTVEPGPSSSPESRVRWADAVTRAAGWIPELSALDF